MIISHNSEIFSSLISLQICDIALLNKIKISSKVKEVKEVNKK